MDLNRATMLGRLTRDPEVRTTPSGKSVANITIATGRVWTDQSGAKQEKTEFHNCVLWGKLADIAGQYLSKGRRVYAEGRLETRDWTGKDDGVKRYRTEVIVDNFIMLDAPRGASAPTGSSDDAPPPPADMGGDEEIKVEDIPF
ncbi:MAG: single-stranded DNA-binding protein [Candidatus Magasanikbacteria bacterium]|jgi:single-strand DNA-binding protein|nr:single-stranded DNA-binding protein [Candidatus Magasanikbacteria bacterium]MBT4315256.1 single-stranded DNA-binding protein [Candidatus Magasanikbacteria bacterium]MBT4547137.1 single-stranded DNA-binding protein [Candidatus Magasanikbacteria bacterium]MBT6819662.1 single-stranded DNA-binding protein [Candidatus Magasanikbacteria bacterium]